VPFLQTLEALHLDRGVMNEHVGSSILADEAIPFRVIEPLHLALKFCHCLSSLMCFQPASVGGQRPRTGEIPGHLLPVNAFPKPSKPAERNYLERSCLSREYFGGFSCHPTDAHFFSREDPKSQSSPTRVLASSIRCCRSMLKRCSRVKRPTRMRSSASGLACDRTKSDASTRCMRSLTNPG